MRFGIPQEFEDSYTHIDEHHHSAYSGLSNGQAYMKQYRAPGKVDIASEVLQEVNASTLVFDAFYSSIDSLARTYQETASSRAATAQHQYNTRATLNKQRAEQSISQITHAFESILGLQSDEVERIIRTEEQKRREEHERRLQKQREEEARIQRVKEEARKEEERKQRELETKKKEAEAKKKQEEEAKKAADAAAAQKAKLASEQAAKDEALRKEQEARAERAKGYGKTSFTAIEKTFTEYTKDIADIKANVVEQLKKEDAQLRKAVSALKRKINPKFGQLSNSMQQLRSVTAEVVALVNDAKFNSNNELVYRWILNFVAKAIVSQAETEVGIKSSAALPLARLALSLLTEYAEFAYYLQARLVKKCPFVIGYTCSIDSEEGRKRMGWRRNAEGKWEDDVKYDERVAGICTLWAVMTRLPKSATFDAGAGASSSSGPAADAGLAATARDPRTFFSLAASWSFVARIANTPLDLLTNAHFSCLGNWWEACALDLLQAYQNQARKLLAVAAITLTDSVRAKKLPAATRLVILGEAFAGGNIQTIKEMES